MYQYQGRDTTWQSWGRVCKKHRKSGLLSSWQNLCMHFSISPRVMLAHANRISPMTLMTDQFLVARVPALHPRQCLAHGKGKAQHWAAGSDWLLQTLLCLWLLDASNRRSDAWECSAPGLTSSLGGIGIRFNSIAKVLAVQLCWKEDMSQPTERRRSEDAPMNLEHIIHWFIDSWCSLQSGWFARWSWTWHGGVCFWIRSIQTCRSRLKSIKCILQVFLSSFVSGFQDSE